MPTYLYETVPLAPDEPVERFEVKQSFNDPALHSHPATGAPVRRVISGGIGLMTRAHSDAALPEPGPGCGPDNCHCGRFS